MFLSRTQRKCIREDKSVEPFDIANFARYFIFITSQAPIPKSFTKFCISPGDLYARHYSTLFPSLIFKFRVPCGLLFRAFALCARSHILVSRRSGLIASSPTFCDDLSQLETSMHCDWKKHRRLQGSKTNPS